MLVLGEFNVQHLVPGSFVAVVSSSFSVLAQARADGTLTEAQSEPRPGGAQAKPDVTQIAIALQSGLSSAMPIAVPATAQFPGAATVVAARKIGSTGSYVAASFRLGSNSADLNSFQLYFNPAPQGQDHTHELQFVIGDDRQIHLQPPLTPNLDRLGGDLTAAVKAGDTARKAVARRKAAAGLLKPPSMLARQADCGAERGGRRR